QPVVLEAGRVCLAQHRRGRDRALLDRGENRPLPRLLELLELERRRLPRLGWFRTEVGRGSLRRRPGRWWGLVAQRGEPLLELLEAVGDRLAREVGRGTGDLDERELERQPGVTALPHVLDGDGEQVDQAQSRRLPELVRLLAEA